MKKKPGKSRLQNKIFMDWEVAFVDLFILISIVAFFRGSVYAYIFDCYDKNLIGTIDHLIGQMCEWKLAEGGHLIEFIYILTLSIINTLINCEVDILQLIIKRKFKALVCT